MPKQEYEYCSQVRFQYPSGQISAWMNIKSTRNRHGIYKTLGAARAIITSEKKEEDRRRRTYKDCPVYDYRILRRPIGQWEEF